MHLELPRAAPEIGAYFLSFVCGELSATCGENFNARRRRMGSRFSRGQCLEIGVDADDDLIADTICLADFDSELRTLDALHNSIQSQEVNLLVDADIHPTEVDYV